jgi:hypothetical protein
MTTVEEWLAGPRSQPRGVVPLPASPGATDPRSSAVAVALGLNSPILWSMTRRQIEAFLTLCKLQAQDAGCHSLLPNVVAEFVVLARCP